MSTYQEELQGFLPSSENSPRGLPALCLCAGVFTLSPIAQIVLASEQMVFSKPVRRVTLPQMSMEATGLHGALQMYPLVSEPLAHARTVVF